MARKKSPRQAVVSGDVRMRLLRNCVICGEFARKGEEFSFPYAEAIKRLETTSDTWEALNLP